MSIHLEILERDMADKGLAYRLAARTPFHDKAEVQNLKDIYFAAISAYEQAKRAKDDADRADRQRAKQEFHMTRFSK